MMKLRAILSAWSLCAATWLVAETPIRSGALPAFEARLESTLTRHLNQLLRNDGSPVSFKGKTA
jgi:hypothetical protein